MHLFSLDPFSAFPKDLADFATELNPKCVVPIHSNSPEAFPELLSKIKLRLLKDGEEWNCVDEPPPAP